jgi:hypothetical protein
MPPAAKSGKPGPRICPGAASDATFGRPSAPQWRGSRRLPPCWMDGPLAASPAPGRHGTHRERERGAAHRSVVDLSSDQTIRHDLHEDTARVDLHAVIVPPIDSAKLPASAAVVEVLKEAVPGATTWMCLNRVAAVLLEQPDRLQVSLAAVGSFHVPAFDQALRGVDGAKAHRCSIGRVVGNLFGGLHLGTLLVQRGREGVSRESRLSLMGRELSKVALGARLSNRTVSITIYAHKEQSVRLSLSFFPCGRAE